MQDDLLKKLEKLTQGDQIAIEMNDEILGIIQGDFVFKSEDSIFFTMNGPLMGVTLDRIKDVRKIGGVLLNFRGK